MTLTMQEPTVETATVGHSFAQPVQVQIQKLPHAPASLPTYATPGSAGMDVRAALEAPVTLQPLERQLIPTGFIMALPEGYECQIRPRSGLSIKHGITLINCVGTIDSDYRHEVKVPVVNLSNTAFTIEPGERIAQLLVSPVSKTTWVEVQTVDAVEGRSGGFGSTGTK